MNKIHQWPLFSALKVVGSLQSAVIYVHPYSRVMTTTLCLLTETSVSLETHWIFLKTSVVKKKKLKEFYV